MKQIEGGFKELTSQTFYDSINRENYLHIQLTDRAVIPNMMNQLRKIYPRVIGVERLFGREERQKQAETKKEVKTLAPVELVDQFFSEVTGESLTPQQQRWIEENLGAIHQAERGK